MTIYIICHEDLPYYPPPEGSKIIWLNAKPAPKTSDIEVIDGYAFFENPEELHAAYSGSLGTMTILKILQGGSRTPHTTIWQYRKFLTRAALPGSRVSDAGEVRLMDLANAIDAVVENPEHHLAPEDLLIHSPVSIHTVIGQYAFAHDILDFLRYSTMLVEQGLLTREEARFFVLIRYFAIGGVELGTFPTDWWMESYGLVRASAEAFTNRFEPAQPNDAYQRRAVSFLQERLGSYKIVMRLTQGGRKTLADYTYGTLHTVSDAEKLTGGT
jgi:hypothetical protein